MNYLLLIRKFHYLHKQLPFNSGGQLLYIHLLEICNEFRWKNPFNQNNKSLCARIGISEPTLIKAKRELQKRGLIEYHEGSSYKGNSVYRIINIVDTVIHIPKEETKEEAKETTEDLTKKTLDYNKEKEKLNFKLPLNNNNKGEEEKNCTGLSPIIPQEEMLPPVAPSPPKNENEIPLPVQQCFELYFYADMMQQSRDHLVVASKLDFKTLRSFGYRFNEYLEMSNQGQKTLTGWCRHFVNWLNKQNLNQSPEKAFNNGSKPNITANKPYQANSRGGATFEQLQALKRNRNTNSDTGNQFSHYEIVE